MGKDFRVSMKKGVASKPLCHVRVCNAAPAAILRITDIGVRDAAFEELLKDLSSVHEAFTLATVAIEIAGKLLGALCVPLLSRDSVSVVTADPARIVQAWSWRL